MNKKITNRLIQNVKKLKNKYKIFGLKTEFEAEGSTIEEAKFIQKICNKFNLKHKIKMIVTTCHNTSSFSNSIRTTTK